MRIRIFQFSAVILTALALVPGGAHLLELPHKIGLGRESYLTVQQIYRGWALLGIILVAAVLASLLLAYLSRGQRTPALCAGAAAVLLGATLVIFFAWTFPVNQATVDWSRAPEGWELLRARWEYSHAANALLTLLALCAATASGLAWRDRSS
jgi:hypothetical protein